MVATSTWVWWSIALLAVAMAIFALPARLEGPVLVRISALHAISVVDALAVGLLLGASTLSYAGLWRGRLRLLAIVHRYPGRSLVVGVAAGAGLGLLLASAFSDFAEWWAIGAVLFGAALIGTSLVVGRNT